MKKFIILLPALLFFSFNQTGDYPFSKWDAATFEKANTAKDVSSMSAEEKKVVQLVNLARLNPDLFARTYMQKWLDSTKTKPTSFVNSLKNDLTARVKPMDALTVKDDLNEEAVSHAKDMGAKGNMGHFTSDGKSYEWRMKKFKGVYAATAENCDYGSNDALSIVMSLLIDEGQGTAQHRKNILNKDHKHIGVSIKPHKKMKWTCVMEMAK